MLSPLSSSPRGFRLHIGVFGRRNAGKSSLVNLLSGQETSLVSEVPGTTTDPVEKAMEFPPLGPVVFIDTAGVDDDAGELGRARSGRALSIVERTDLALVVFEGDWGADEQALLERFAAKSVPVVAVASKSDKYDRPLSGPPDGVRTVQVGAATGVGLEELRQAIIELAPADFIESPVLVRDLVPPGGTVVLVTPIDSEAPRGRLILPQVQTIRDLLDGDCVALVTKENTLASALAGLRNPPALTVTDSQAFGAVSEIVGESVPLTGFSILFARAKGDLCGFARGAAAIDGLRDGDRILVAESCSHHSADDDIGRVKLPALIRKRTGVELDFSFVSGHDFPDDLCEYSLILHCGACMTNRRAVLSRQARAAAAGIPVVNYGMAIAHCLGLLDRALAPFPEALAAFRAARHG